jgi:hypothetical protein
LRHRHCRVAVSPWASCSNVGRREPPLQIVLGDQLRYKLTVAHTGLVNKITGRKYQRQ